MESGWKYEYRKEPDLSVVQLSDFSSIGWQLVSTYNLNLSNTIIYVLRKKVENLEVINEKEIASKLEKDLNKNFF